MYDVEWLFVYDVRLVVRIYNVEWLFVHYAWRQIGNSCMMSKM